jgi:nitroimidazol reductase NimA-like FMN-containing flavoprotein (pyridoxamine 5'-phosphate oxidase superfamily)
MTLTKAERAFINSQGVARISTVTEDGMPHNVPVCPLLDRGHIYVASEKTAKKMKNIEANPKAAIVFDVYRDSWKDLRGVMLQCDARVVGDADFKRLRRKFYTKYPKYKTYSAIELEDSAIIELVPVNKFSWGI